MNIKQQLEKIIRELHALDSACSHDKISTELARAVTKLRDLVPLYTTQTARFRGTAFKVPACAKYIAKDVSGVWYWYNQCPEYCDDAECWVSRDDEDNKKEDFLCAQIPELHGVFLERHPEASRYRIDTTEDMEREYWYLSEEGLVCDSTFDRHDTANGTTGRGDRYYTREEAEAKAAKLITTANIMERCKGDNVMLFISDAGLTAKCLRELTEEYGLVRLHARKGE